MTLLLLCILSRLGLKDGGLGLDSAVARLDKSLTILMQYLHLQVIAKYHCLTHSCGSSRFGTLCATNGISHVNNKSICRKTFARCSITYDIYGKIGRN